MDILIFILTRPFWLASLIVKEFGVFCGIVEQIIKILVGIVSLTPTREDDEVIQTVEDLWDVVQEKIYNIATLIYEFYDNLFFEIKK
ncbi:MAG TPA: hypothetical protein PLK48_06135 [Caldisericia bacterium]|nr:hypothetical protein [Caldisericia bacterium]